jgi:enoyl-CoA hydratase/carnithine racemase
MTGTKVSLAVERGTGWITLDGPERRNALNARAARGLAARGLAAVSRDGTGRASRLAGKSGNPVETAGRER